jgi:hypothetical protein
MTPRAIARCLPSPVRVRIRLASGEGRGGVARVASSRLTTSEVEPAPIPGQELIQFLDGMLGDASQDIGEPGLRINVIHFGRDDQAVHHRRPLAAAVRAAEQPRLPTQSDAAHAALGGIV